MDSEENKSLSDGQESIDDLLKELMGEEEYENFTKEPFSAKGFAETLHFQKMQNHDRDAKSFGKDYSRINPEGATSEFLDDVLEMLGLDRKGLPLKVLDVGCGNGYLTRILHTIGWEVTGLDSSSGLVREAKAGSPDIRYVHGNASHSNADFENDPFDLIIGKDVVWSFFEPDLVLENWKRWLKRPGRIVIIWHHEGEDPSGVAGESLLIQDEFDRSLFSYDYAGISCDFVESLLRTGYQDLKFAWMARVNAGQVRRKIDYPYFMLVASRT